MARSDVVVKQPLGVCGVGEDTKMLAELAAAESFDGCKVLDVGTGTGYIAISLARLGATVHATDIDEKALAVAGENAKLNDTKIRLISSNLFENVSEKYDIITFNPPISRAPGAVKSFVRRLPLTNLFVPLYLSLSGGKNKLLDDFMAGVKNHLAPNGKIVITAPLREIESIAARQGFKKLKHVKRKQDFVVLSV